MNTLTNTHARDIGALVATLFGIVLVGLFALMLMSRDGGADPGVNVDPPLAEPALPQGARYPQTSEKFAPGRIVPTATPASEAVGPGPCQGEGLLDIANRTVLSDAVGSIARYCDYLAYPAGNADGVRPLDPRGEGLGGRSPRD